MSCMRLSYTYSMYTEIPFMSVWTRRYTFSVLLFCLNVLLLFCCSSFQCMSMLNTSRRIYQQLVLLSLLFVVLSVIIVFVKLINVVFHVEIIIIIIVIRKHLFVLILYFSMCCHYYIRSKKKENKTWFISFSFIDILNILVQIDPILNEQSHKQEIKNNHGVYLVFHYQYGIFILF